MRDVFIATIKTCTDEQTIIQRAFSTMKGAGAWLKEESEEWAKCHGGGYFAEDFPDGRHWKDPASNDEVYYFVLYMQVDNPKSEKEWK